MISFECQFISGGCNAVYNAMDFCQFGDSYHLLAYPCANQVLVYDCNKIKVLYSFSHFNARVNVVRFLDSKVIIAADCEGQIVIFNKDQVIYKTKASDSIATLKIIRDYILTLSIDGKVSIYNQKLQLLSSLEFGNIVMECVDAIFYQDNYIVALSGVGNGVHIYSIVNDQLQFKTTLKGHVRSVNALAFQLLDPESIILASGSKDTFVRLWKMQPGNSAKSFEINNIRYDFHLESVLQGHCEEVSSLCWDSPSCLASGSFDYNILIWTQDKETQIWLSNVRLGQSSGNKNQIFGIQYSKDRKLLCGYTLTGAFYLWDNEWKELPIISGHFGPVTDLDFKDYLISCSSDQTTRLYCQYKENGTYHEISRVQVHGYDLNTVRQLGQCIISGGDEKVLRIFSPSAFAINQLNYLSETSINLEGVQFTEIEYKGRIIKEYKTNNDTVQQALGLMNIQQQGFDEDEENVGEIDNYPENEIQNIALDSLNTLYKRPPTDALLMLKSLWPEQNKLYGHGYAIQCVDTFQDIAASASMAMNEKAAEIIIWNTKNYKILQRLPCHSYTVQQLKFSQSGTYLISVSKDRCVGLFKCIDNQYQLIAKSQPCSRIVYCCTINKEETLIFTGSRDKKLRIYDIQLNLVKELDIGQAITSIDINDQYIAVGLANGGIQLRTFDFDLVCQAQQIFQHNKQVNRLVFKGNQLATCGDDNTVRLFDINIK